MSAFLVLLSGCSPAVDKDFLSNLIADSKQGLSSFKRAVRSMAYDGKGKYLVVGHESGVIDIWNARKAKSKISIHAHHNRVSTITFAANSEYFFTNSYFEHVTKLWRANRVRLVASIPNTSGPVCVTQDKNIYVIGDHSRFRLFDFKHRQLLPGSFKASGVVTSVARAPSSQLIAVGTASGNIDLWRFHSKSGAIGMEKVKSIYPHPVGDWIVGLQFSQDGNALYSVSRSGAVDEWSAATLKHVRSFSPKIRSVQSVAFSPEKQLVALGGTVARNGMGLGSVDVISLASGKAEHYYANTNLPVVGFIPAIDRLIVAQHKLIEPYDTDLIAAVLK